ncbi:hypothetical protein CBA19CS22_13980 [Caballeronia novacaledonica]|uniref:Uncharacterized protein n=1 Tax=Caballeronia novacaledonica TaxID=1544861 RepID=A0ACB5QR36_9BURK|nr:hypothetical protein CBA19CS22_13980 [Caballeronia novacaledonica]
MKLTADVYLAPTCIGPRRDACAGTHGSSRQAGEGHHFSKSALETALLDAHGKRLGVSGSEVLGNRHRERLPVAWTLASGDTNKDIAGAEMMLERRRHKLFKLKIGAKDTKADIEHVADIKRVLGDRASVRVDVNMAWGETRAA